MQGLTKRQMVRSLESAKLDKIKTANLFGEFGCVDIFGGTYLASSPESFLENLSNLGVNVKDLTFKEGLWYKDYKEKQEDIVEIKKEVSEETVEEVPVVSDKKEQELEVDWDWVYGLTNTSPSKKLLEEYARKFDIELKRNKTLENMQKDFKEALES